MAAALLSNEGFSGRGLGGTRWRRGEDLLFNQWGGAGGDVCHEIGVGGGDVAGGDGVGIERVLIVGRLRAGELRNGQRGKRTGGELVIGNGDVGLVVFQGIEEQVGADADGVEVAELFGPEPAGAAGGGIAVPGGGG